MTEDCADHHYRLLRKSAHRKTAALIDQGVNVVKPSPGDNAYTWKVIDKSLPSKPVEDYGDSRQ